MNPIATVTRAICHRPAVIPERWRARTRNTTPATVLNASVTAGTARKTADSVARTVASLSPRYTRVTGGGGNVATQFRAPQ